jgi:hypothetical protein
MVIDADAPDAPFGKDIRLHRQRLQLRPVEFLQKLAPGTAKPTDDALFVEARHQIGDRGVQLGEAVESPVTQTAEQPALDDEDAALDLGLLSSPGLQFVLTLKRV